MRTSLVFVVAGFTLGCGRPVETAPPLLEEPGELRECPATHPRIGEMAVLEGKGHSVEGTARIVDDCTIAFEDFRYDGGGIDVRVYGALGGDYREGFAISGDLVGTRFEGTILVVQLPEDRTLDDLDGVSIWCTAADVSFGDALFSR